MLARALLLCVLGLCVDVARAQPVLVSPLPHGIVQVTKDRQAGALRIIVRSGKTAGDQVLAIDHRFTDAYNKSLFSEYWSSLRASNGAIDVTLNVPFYGKSFKLHYRIVTPDSIYQGEVQDLAIGHVFGVAGQSNAEGWSPPPYPRPVGDVRVLRGTKVWEYGSNPSGGRWNGPWVYMANKFRELVPDGLPIGIVNAAEGGTSLAVWWTQSGNWIRNNSIPDDIYTVYGRALRMFRAAGANMEAMFWIQGEADVVETSIEGYRAAFRQLVLNLESDLQHDLNFYHLQISGQLDNGGEWRPLGWGWIREAQRDLPESKLVGSAVAYPISFDGIHYEITTTETVGHRFAAAVAHEQYGISSALYPAMLPDTAIFVYIDSLRPELGWKVLLRCTQGENAAGLDPNEKLYQFELRCADARFDTTRVTARVHSYAPGWIEVWLEDSVILDTAGWYLSYAVRADVQGANVLDTCTASNLPNALVAFLDLPIGSGSEPERPEPQRVADEPESTQDCVVRYFDLTGRHIDLNRRDLAPGPYLEVRGCGGRISTQKWLVR